MVSITEAIDAIFEKICNKINEIIGQNIGLKFFLRRTLAGCEFGICFDFNIKVEHDDFELRRNCIIDTDPLFVFTIFVKRLNFLAAILIIGLVFISIMVKNLIEIIINFIGKSTKFIVKKLSILAFEFLADKGSDFAFNALFDKIFDKLISIIQKQLTILESKNNKFVGVCYILLNIFTSKEFSGTGDYFKDHIINKSKKFKFKGHSNIMNNLPLKYLVKTGVLLMLAFVSFMMNFHYRDNQKQSLKYEEKITKKYEEKIDKKCEELPKDSDIDATIKENDLEKMVKDVSQYETNQTS